MTRFLALPALLLALAACEPTVLPVEPDGGIGDTPPDVLPVEPDGGIGGGIGDGDDACGAQGLVELVGQPVTAVTSMLLVNPYRIIRPGEAVTMDFSPTRINFELDGEGRVARVYCG